MLKLCLSKNCNTCIIIKSVILNSDIGLNKHFEIPIH